MAAPIVTTGSGGRPQDGSPTTSRTVAGLPADVVPGPVIRLALGGVPSERENRTAVLVECDRREIEQRAVARLARQATQDARVADLTGMEDRRRHIGIGEMGIGGGGVVRLGDRVA